MAVAARLPGLATAFWGLLMLGSVHQVEGRFSCVAEGGELVAFNGFIVCCTPGLCEYTDDDRDDIEDVITVDNYCEVTETIPCICEGYPECGVSTHYYVGDGDCDSGANNAECGWDHGDCCAESCCPDQKYDCGDGSSDFDDCDDPNPNDNPRICQGDVDLADSICGDPHMLGLRGQHIDWSGVNGGWYSLIKDETADLHINIRLTAPLPDEFPDRQLITGLSVLSGGHSFVVEVNNPYTIDTDGCPGRMSPCLANGGLHLVVDGKVVNDLLRFSREVPVVEGIISMSASNLPVECRQFGGDKIWARTYAEMREESRVLSSASTLEDWILSFPNMAAPEWCAKYIAEHDLEDLQSTHAIFKIETPTVVVRLNAGTNYQGGGELDGDGRVLPDLDFWQMDVGLDGLDVKNPILSGILGETARPVYDAAGRAIMEGFDAFRGDVEDYRVTGPLGTHFVLLDREGADHQ